LRDLTLSSLREWGDWAGKATLRAMLYSPHLTNLRSLVVSNQPHFLSKSGPRELAKWPGLARLERLSLSGFGGLNNDGLRWLTQSENVVNLRELSLSCPAVDYRILAQSPYLNGLRRLRIGDASVSASVRAALVARFGDAAVFGMD